MAEARVIDGKVIAAGLRRDIAAAAIRLRETQRLTPGLATVLVGNDAASQSYIRAKAVACTAGGLASFDLRFPHDVSETTLIAEIGRLNIDERVDGILMQLPLPAQIDPHRVIAAIDPAKDVDGFHPINVGRLWTGLPGLVPCTPQGCLLLLRSVRPDLSGAAAVVVGRSNIVGKPIAALLLAADCTVTWVHSKSRDAPSVAAAADIVIAAIGRPRLIGAEWIKPGGIVIDVGINALPGSEGRDRIVGDVDFSAVSQLAGAITPVPGGVGPMTIACLLRNTVLAACRRRGLTDPLPL